MNDVSFSYKDGNIRIQGQSMRSQMTTGKLKLFVFNYIFFLR